MLLLLVVVVRRAERVVAMTVVMFVVDFVNPDDVVEVIAKEDEGAWLVVNAVVVIAADVDCVQFLPFIELYPLTHEHV